MCQTMDGKSVVTRQEEEAAGYDEIPASIMKPLTHLINQSILQGHFPKELKPAKVLPIFISEDEQLVQNYRPMSILPFFSKLFEKTVSKYIIEFMDEN